MISKRTNIWVALSASVVVVSIIAAFVSSPTISPEFSGKASVVVTFDNATSSQAISEAIQSSDNAYTIEQKAGNTYHITSSAIDDEAYVALTSSLKESVGTFSVDTFESFSPEISQELLRKSIIALVIAVFIIIIFIAFSFSAVSFPVASWKYGIVAVMALVHDIIIPFGIFAVIGHITSASIDVLFVTALLAILGYSINDTVVVFDRIREQLRLRGKDAPFEGMVDSGVRQSIRRSVYTSVSTLIPLLLLTIFVPVTQWFAFTLFIGILAGTYSSLFFAPSLLVLWQRHFPQDEQQKDNRTETEKIEKDLIANLKGVDTI